MQFCIKGMQFCKGILGIATLFLAGRHTIKGGVQTPGGRFIMYDWLINLHHIVTVIFQTLDRAYGTLLLIGAFGVAAQAALGFLHGGHGHDAHGHTGDMAHAGHSYVSDAVHTASAHHTPIPHHGSDSLHSVGTASSHGTQGAQHHGSDAISKNGGGAWNWLGLLSPMTIFSVCLGTGAVGLLVRAYMGSIATGLLATAGGVAFYCFAVRPLMSLILAFASKPATNLSGVVAREAVATGRFDAQGRGIVQVNIDGEVKRLLARLDAEDHKAGVTVSSGDHVLVTDIDPQKNACRVTRL
jgi:hypothetical protein